MNLSAKTIRINDNTDIKLHPLSAKLYKLIMRVYIVGGQEEYIKFMTDQFNCYRSLPIHNVSLVSKEANEYLLIGGCFSPVFNLKDLHNDNTIFLSYKTSKKMISLSIKSRLTRNLIRMLLTLFLWILFEQYRCCHYLNLGSYIKVLKQ